MCSLILYDARVHEIPQVFCGCVFIAKFPFSSAFLSILFFFSFHTMPEKYTWAPWASTQATSSGVLMMIGGIVGIWYPRMYLSMLALALGLFVVLFERYAPLLPLGVVSENYWVRMVMYLLVSVVCVWEVPTVTGGVCLVLSALTYGKAASRGEMCLSRRIKKW